MSSAEEPRQPYIEYPDLQLIRVWYFALKANDEFQKAFYLPEIDDAWCERMLSAFQTTALRPDCRLDITQASARIFYKITKGHYRIDGNKRSAVVCTFFFLALNGLWIAIPPVELYRFSKEVAMSDPKDDEKETARIASKFGTLLRTF